MQIAKALGATVVLSGSKKKLSKAKELGAYHVVDRSLLEWTEFVMQATGGRGVDHVLEIVGGDHLGPAAEVTATHPGAA